MSVGRLCIRTVDTAEPKESVQTVAARMNSHNVGMLVVVGTNNRPLGIITDRDLTIGVLAVGKDPLQTRVEEVMSCHPRPIPEDGPLEDALGIMRAGPYRRLPVVNDSGALVGVLAIDDVLGLLAEEFAQIRRVLERESPTAMGFM